MCVLCRVLVHVMFVCVSCVHVCVCVCACSSPVSVFVCFLRRVFVLRVRVMYAFASCVCLSCRVCMFVVVRPSCVRSDVRCEAIPSQRSRGDARRFIYDE